jgi:valyl-tRNA synthetase
MAIAVNPEDVRYSKYIGRSVVHPIRHDKLPIIADSMVDQEFGTGKLTFAIIKLVGVKRAFNYKVHKHLAQLILNVGAVKVTPAHDQKDYEIAVRHGIEMLSIFDNQGIANKNCSEFSVCKILYNTVNNFNTSNDYFSGTTSV